ncbi:MAG TPA: arginine--tRNA ligase [Planctomycetota bacterium]|nr:arginine--tRNA ligase [Planctomycetota bacterium]
MLPNIVATWGEALAELIRKGMGVDVSGEAFQPLITPTQDMKFGDYTTGVCFKLAKALRKGPPQIANELASLVEGAKLPHLAKVEAAGGYLNLALTRAYLELLVDVIHQRCADYGMTERFKGVRILLEYVSANPTGPLTIAAARQAAVGDTLARLLKFAGASVTREYYVNDTGGQIHNLGLSILSRAADLAGRKLPFPEDGYRGEYVKDLGGAALAAHGPSLFDKPDSAQLCARLGRDELMKSISADLKVFGADFDVFSSQEALEKSGKVEKTLNVLKEKGLVFDLDGAQWLRTTQFGDDKDRVMVKSDGSYTYRTPDIAYHRDKFERGFDRLIDLLGPDHRQEAKEVAMGLKALGYDAERRVRVIFVEHCRLMRGGEEVKMSKRLATYVTLRELIDEVGVDAARYFFLMRRVESHLDFDIEVAKKQSLDNPVYYAQYAHARICSANEKAVEKGAARAADIHGGLFSREADPRLLDGPELQLIRMLERFPQVVADAAADLDTAKLTSYVYNLSGAFQSYYTEGNKDPAKRMVTEDPARTAARLRAAAAVQIVLRTALGLLGVTAPSKM